MQKITPNLWFDREAKEAAGFYTSVFPSSRVTNVTTLHGTPSGDCDVVSFELWGHSFMAISAGPLFKFNPSVSFIVRFGHPHMAERGAREKIDQVWNSLSAGGTILMPLDRYPFSERFGWVMDRYGPSWQLILATAEGDPRPPVMPALMFVGANCGKAEEAREFYLSVFRNSRPGVLVRYGPGQEPSREGTVMFTDFMLEDTWFAAMDSAGEHQFSFNEAISLMVSCDTQEEIDYYWAKLSSVREAEQCGWLKDKYGLSWQIVPAVMAEMMARGTREQIDRLTQAFLPMKKLVIAELEKAYAGS